jgi:hypothetical protein
MVPVASLNVNELHPHECGKGQQRQSLTRAGRSATLTGEIIVGFTLGQILAEPYLACLVLLQYRAM